MTLLATFQILGLPATVNQIGRKHWIVKHKEAKKWQRLVFEKCLQYRLQGLRLEKAHLEFTRHSSREPDFDNLAGSFKHVLDGLTKAQVILDDKPSIIGSPTFNWEKAGTKEGRITVKIYSLKD